MKDLFQEKFDSEYKFLRKLKKYSSKDESRSKSNKANYVISKDFTSISAKLLAYASVIDIAYESMVDIDITSLEPTLIRLNVPPLNKNEISTLHNLSLIITDRYKDIIETIKDITKSKKVTDNDGKKVRKTIKLWSFYEFGHLSDKGDPDTNINKESAKYYYDKGLSLISKVLIYSISMLGKEKRIGVKTSHFGKPSLYDSYTLSSLYDIIDLVADKGKESSSFTNIYIGDKEEIDVNVMTTKLSDYLLPLNYDAAGKYIPEDKTVDNNEDFVTELVSGGDVISIYDDLRLGISSRTTLGSIISSLMSYSKIKYKVMINAFMFSIPYAEIDEIAEATLTFLNSNILPHLAKELKDPHPLKYNINDKDRAGYYINKYNYKYKINDNGDIDTNYIILEIYQTEDKVTLEARNNVEILIDNDVIETRIFSLIGDIDMYSGDYIVAVPIDIATEDDNAGYAIVQFGNKGISTYDPLASNIRVISRNPIRLDVKREDIDTIDVPRYGIYKLDKGNSSTVALRYKSEKGKGSAIYYINRRGEYYLKKFIKSVPTTNISNSIGSVMEEHHHAVDTNIPDDEDINSLSNKLAPQGDFNTYQLSYDIDTVWKTKFYNIFLTIGDQLKREKQLYVLDVASIYGKIDLDDATDDDLNTMYLYLQTYQQKNALKVALKF